MNNLRCKTLWPPKDGMDGQHYLMDIRFRHTDDDKRSKEMATLL